MRFRDIEFRWCKGSNIYELVKWYKGAANTEYCCAIAFFDETKEGYDMRTVGDRFFEDKDAWFVGKHGLAFLNDMFDQLKREEDE